MSSSSSSSSSNPSDSSSSAPPKLPLKPIPGDYGLPFFGPIKDRYNYFYNQGKDEFFKTRIQKYNSTIFRTNMPPGSFIASNPKVIAVLDAVSFPVLFDTSKVEKRNVLDGTYMPSTSFTGGYRVCAYLDPSEPNHASLKRFFLSLLASRHHKFIPLFQNHLSNLFLNLETEISKNGKADFNTPSDDMSFKFVFSLFCGSENTSLGSKGPNLVALWLAPQLAPQITLGSPKLLSFAEDLLLHTFSYPAFLVKSTYKKLYDAFYESSASVLDEAENSFGIPRDEACHNLLFLACFNAFGGMKLLFPALIKWVGSAGEDLHRQLRNEIRAFVKENDGNVTFSALDKMTLTKSVVYEALRIEPPVPFQYGKAKEDIMVHSHDAAFEIKKGEMIFGYQPFATKDPKIFENPEEFVGHRFVGEGEKLLKYVYWSNGREIDDPTVENKQCAGKNLVLLVSRLMLVEFFLRYDTCTVDVTTASLGASVTFKTLTKAS
ncbi:allene oxide synthase 1, chloroplastic-like [Rosa rugosa]|uniref:allene oxide synthase 1, chloroplastic-like n=1 Tax=Rosa rugosa TaxID=74645 RepID=UPI002B40C209|nr:allene oxide synthase 1, chloroplastic-like [Rosa rugosa]